MLFVCVYVRSPFPISEDKHLKKQVRKYNQADNSLGMACPNEAKICAEVTYVPGPMGK